MHMHMTQISAAKIPYLQRIILKNELVGGLSAMQQRTVRNSNLPTYQRIWINLQLYGGRSAIQ